DFAAGEGGVAGGAVGGKVIIAFGSGAEFGLDAENFGDDIAGFFDDNLIAELYAEALQLVDIMEGGAGDGAAGDEYGREVGDGGDGAEAADLAGDVYESGAGLFCAELVGRHVA